MVLSPPAVQSSRREIRADPVLAGVADAVDALCLGGERILVAVSGGIDSVVLLHALHRLAPGAGLGIVAGHVHHGLRGEQADEDCAAVEAAARKLGLPFGWTRVDLHARREGLSSRERPTLQEAGRAARYEALNDLAREHDCARIATGHNADDQAETLLLRLLRGTGPDGLAGIPAISPDRRVVRPLLELSRVQIEAHARGRGIAWREDPSNADPRYARSRLRSLWIPGLAKDFNPQLLRTLGQMAEAQRRDSEWLAALVDDEARLRIRDDSLPDEIRIRRAGWAELPPSLSRRLLRQAWIGLGGGRDLTRVHLERMEQLTLRGRPGARIELPGGLILVCETDEVRLRRGGVECEGKC